MKVSTSTLVFLTICVARSVFAITDVVSEECYSCTHNVYADSADSAQKRAALKLTASLLGNAADSAAAVNPLSGPVLIIGGGSTDVDRAYQTGIDLERGCNTAACAPKSDLTILRVTGTDAYNPSLINLTGVDSVETLIMTKVTDANLASVETKIKNSEWIFYAGGNQCDYTTIFKGSKVDTATKFAYARGASVGGTSAGAAILGEYVYNGCASSQGTTSAQALANPYDSGISFTYGYNNFNFMNKTITDQHFKARDRMGRLLAFLARQIKDGKTSIVWGVAVNEQTAVVVDKNGLATVVRNDGIFGGNPVPAPSADPVAYVILLDTPPTTCVAGSPLTASGYKVWKLLPGQTYNLATRPTTGFSYTLSVSAGVVSSSSGSIY
jgi:cyanophycinase